MTWAERKHLFVGCAINLERHTVAIIEVRGPKDHGVASGILVKLQERLFIATAGHCVPLRHTERLALVTRTAKALAETRLPILNAGSSHPTGPDAGYLELDPTFLSTGKQPIEVDRISTRGQGNVDWGCFVLGYPAALMAPNHQQQAMSFRPAFYTAKPLRESEWPAIDPSIEPFDSGTDVVLNYDLDEELMPIDENSANRLTKPGGMSGGGIWQGGTHDGVWSPELAKLFAIQSSWNERARYLRAVQIIHWLELIHRDYPDLRSTLQERFPTLAPLRRPR